MVGSIRKTQAAALLLTAALAGTGCTSRKHLFPETGPDMLDIYHRHMQQAGAPGNVTRWRRRLQADPPPPARPPGGGMDDLAGYTRTAATEIRHLFPLLPNPWMTVYVFPHLSREGVAVPGYSTAFPLYEVDQPALPGEGYRP